MIDVRVIPISDKYRENYDKIFRPTALQVAVCDEVPKGKILFMGARPYGMKTMVDFSKRKNISGGEW